MIKAGGFRYNVKGVHDGTDLQPIAAMKVRDASGLHTIWTDEPAVSVLVPIFASGYAFSSGTVSVTSELVNGVVVGGTAPFTYLWATTGGDTMTIIDSTKVSTKFVSSLAGGETSEATFTLTVTDSNGETATSDVLTVTLMNSWEA